MYQARHLRFEEFHFDRKSCKKFYTVKKSQPMISSVLEINVSMVWLIDSVKISTPTIYLNEILPLIQDMWGKAV